MCPAWLLVVAVVGVARGAASQCWEHPSCQDLSSESNMLDCLHLCHSDLLTEESPIFPGEAHLLQTPSLTSSSSSDTADPSSLLLPPSSSLLLTSSPSDPHQSEVVRVPARRSYSMEHFRWGKPVGRKRRPIKVYTSAGGNGAALEAPADSSDELSFLPSEMRRELGNEVLQEEEEGGVLRQEAGGASSSSSNNPNAAGGPAEKRRDGSYKMSHFRWSGPPATKRYGGFMKSWDERSQGQKPLLTLFKNVINKDAVTGQE